MISFKNKKVLITGATGGIGSALLKKFITLELRKFYTPKISAFYYYLKIKKINYEKFFTISICGSDTIYFIFSRL